VDNFTLIICTILISFFLTSTTLVLYLTSRGEKYLIDWAIAGACFLFSNIVRALNFEFDLSFVVVATLANSCYIAGNIAIMTGVIRLTIKKTVRKIIFLGALLVAGVHQLAIFQGSIDVRIMFLFPLAVLLNSTSFLFLWRHRTQSGGSAYWPLLLALGFYTLEITVRGVFMVWDPIHFPMQGNELMRTLGTLFLMLYLFMLTISFVVIINWKRELILRKVGITDKLTGWLNRNDFDKLVTTDFHRAKIQRQLFGFIYFDIDHFKSINDEYGHSIGDTAIKHVCDLAAKHTRDSDHRFRMGGEEFVICVTKGDVETLNSIAQRIRHEIYSQPLVVGELTIAITVSVGISVATERDTSWETVLERADKGLFQSKGAGRNRVSPLLSPDSEITA